MLRESVSTHPRFVSINRDREKSAQKARDAQDKYKKTASRFLISTTGAAIVGGLLLYGLDSEIASEPLVKSIVVKPAVQKALIVIQSLCLAAAAYFGFVQSRLRHDNTWVKNRLRAEAGRIDRAIAALEIGHAEDSNSFKSAGNYFLDELIDKQLVYLSKAALVTENKSRQLVLIGALFAAVTALLTSLLGLGIDEITLIGALIGVVSPAFVSALQTWESAMSNQERALLHDATWEKLNHLSGDRLEFQKAIDDNNLEDALKPDCLK